MGFISGFSSVSGTSCFSPGNATTKARTRVLKKCDDVDKAAHLPAFQVHVQPSAGQAAAARDVTRNSAPQKNKVHLIISHR